MNVLPNPTGMPEALDGVRVLDCSQILAGPFCSMLLADMGADVIKVEKPNGGDDTRRMGPPFIGEESVAFLAMNRNKRSVVLNFKDPAGVEALKRLATDADIVIENYRTGAMDRLGFGYDELSKRNPRLIYASISGYGRSGEFATKGGFDLVLQGFTGLMALTGPEDTGPHRMPIPVCDITAGMQLAIGVLTALESRRKTGKGQWVEASLFEAGLSLQLYESAGVFATGEAPERLGQRHRGVAPYQIFATSTDHITIGVAQQNFWLKLLRLLGRPTRCPPPPHSLSGSSPRPVSALLPPRLLRRRLRPRPPPARRARCSRSCRRGGFPVA